MLRYFYAFCLSLLMTCCVVAAPITYAENLNGELSGDSTAPTDLGIFGIGNNTVSGQVEQVGGFFPGAGFVDFENADIFTFEVAAGTQVDEIFLRSFDGSSNAIFMALDDANTFGFSASQINQANNLGELFPELILAGTVGELDDVDVMGADPDSGSNLFDELIGPASSLGPGQYSVYLQETADATDYTLNFRVSAAAVPEPSTVLTLLPLGCTALLRRRKQGLTNA